MTKALIICYHRINDNSNSYLRPMIVKSFDRQMQYLSKAYNPVSLERIIEHIRDGRPLPPKAIAITFDDGYRDNYENAYPILKKYSIPATVFLTTDYIGTSGVSHWDKVYNMLSQAKKGTIAFPILGNTEYNMPLDKKGIRKIVKVINRLDEKRRECVIVHLADQLGASVDKCSSRYLSLSWDEVREMSNAGISFGAHTMTHPFLTRISHERARKEIYLSRKIIEEQTGKPVRAFAYPAGDFDIHTQKMVEQAGYFGAVSIIPGYNNSKTDRYALRRNAIGLPAKASSLLAVFKAEVTGKVSHLRKCYQRIRGLDSQNAQ